MENVYKKCTCTLGTLYNWLNCFECFCKHFPPFKNSHAFSLISTHYSGYAFTSIIRVWVVFRPFVRSLDRPTWTHIKWKIIYKMWYIVHLYTWLKLTVLSVFLKWFVIVNVAMHACNFKNSYQYPIFCTHSFQRESIVLSQITAL